MDNLKYIINVDLPPDLALERFYQGTLAKTPENVNQIWNIFSSFDYTSVISDKNLIKCWLNSLPYLKAFLKEVNPKMTTILYGSIINVCKIFIEIAYFYHTQSDSEGLINYINIDLLLKVIDEFHHRLNESELYKFPLIPCLIDLDDIIFKINKFQNVHQIDIPSYDEIIRFSLILAILEIKKRRSHVQITLFESFEKSCGYFFEIEKTLPKVPFQLEKIPTFSNPAGFILTRYIYSKITENSPILPIEIENLLTTAPPFDDSNLLNYLIYVNCRKIMFNASLADSKYSTLLFLLAIDQRFDRFCYIEKDDIFHFSPNFIMVKEFVESSRFHNEIHMQMRSLISIVSYVSNKVTYSPIEILNSDYFPVKHKLAIINSIQIPTKLEEIETLEIFIIFWCHKIQALINSIDYIDEEIIIYIFKICKVAFDLYLASKSEDPIMALLNRKDFSNVYTIYDLSLFRFNVQEVVDYRELSRKLTIIQKCLSILKMPFLSIGSLIQNALLCVFMLNGNINDEIINSNMYKEKSLIVIDYFITRYLFSIVENKAISLFQPQQKIKLYETITRKIEELNWTKSIKEIEQSLILFCSNKIDIFSLHILEKVDPKFIFSLLLSDIFNLENISSHLLESKSCSASILITHMFVFGTIDHILQKYIATSLHVINKCQSELDKLLCKSLYGDSTSCLALLERKECVPFLDENNLFHKLLKILLTKPSFPIDHDFGSLVLNIANFCYVEREIDFNDDINLILNFTRYLYREFQTLTYFKNSYHTISFYSGKMNLLIKPINGIHELFQNDLSKSTLITSGLQFILSKLSDNKIDMEQKPELSMMLNILCLSFDMKNQDLRIPFNCYSAFMAIVSFFSHKDRTKCRIESPLQMEFYKTIIQYFIAKRNIQIVLNIIINYPLNMKKKSKRYIYGSNQFLY
ncbi:hypothetical protein TRFO_18289 [Tritrichomonas foetus]|uniref:Uncharacterized protein n=1 Tax=Tritrichomonas foetus TaxID=1144522 RepID=A0A1J4KRB1_9EUKA|nr:hypothetical protein TRFO_18289 [Tritrichomonas foetus]|eukprot:OHT12005.1 hypothetical protein TRFO_18289 [Tritrichomonas foetus]